MKRVKCLMVKRECCDIAKHACSCDSLEISLRSMEVINAVVT